MRTARRLLLAALPMIVAGLAGCASSTPAITAAPSTDELPDLRPYDDRTIQAAIGVEGAHRDFQHRLLAPIVEPPLTAEERAALGIRDRYEFLQFPRHDSSGPVYAYSDTLAAGGYGAGGATVGTGFAKPAIIAGAPTTPVTARYTHASSPYGVGPAATAAAGVGPAVRFDTRSGPAARGAARHPRLNP